MKKINIWLFVCFIALFPLDHVLAKDKKNKNETEFIERVTDIEIEQQKLTGKIESQMNEILILKSEIVLLKKELFQLQKLLADKNNRTTQTEIEDSQENMMKEEVTQNKPIQLSENKQIKTDIIASLNDDEIWDFANLSFQKGEYKNSIKAFERFIETFPNDQKLPQAKYKLGELLLIEKKYAGSAKVFLDLMKNDANSEFVPNSFIKTSEALYQMGKHSDSCKLLKSAKVQYSSDEDYIKKIDMELWNKNC